MNVYKVVTKYEDGSYGSAVISRRDFGHVDYAIGKTSEPQMGCGPLAAFQDLDCALGFARYQCMPVLGVPAILACVAEANDPQRLMSNLPPALLQEMYGAETVWIYGFGRCLVRSLLPYGTVLVSRVVPIMEIGSEELERSTQ